jgi:hypothetical protein
MLSLRPSGVVSQGQTVMLSLRPSSVVPRDK